MGWAIFGKLPSHGDFISRGLSAPQRKALDHWVTQRIGQAPVPDDGLHERLSLAGRQMTAIVVGSHDKPGRVFPIVAITEDPDPAFDGATLALAQAVRDRTDADSLLAILSNLGQDQA